MDDEIKEVGRGQKTFGVPWKDTRRVLAREFHDLTYILGDQLDYTQSMEMQDGYKVTNEEATEPSWFHQRSPFQVF